VAGPAPDDAVGWRGVILALAAAERAQDRWLRETGRWTPELAWVTERLSVHDRDECPDPA
jgi:hypothetical protein